METNKYYNLIVEVLEREKLTLEERGDREAILASGFALLTISPPEEFSGRRGNFTKVEFTYRVSYAEGSQYEDGSPMEPLDFRRYIRIGAGGMVEGISDPILVEDEDN